MLAHLKERICAVLAGVQKVTLATGGPAGVQISEVPCVARELRLYLLLPGTSDHLLNLEGSEAAVVTTAAWQVRGRVRLLGPDELPAQLWPEDPELRWYVGVELQPQRFELLRGNGLGSSETIDIEV